MTKWADQIYFKSAIDAEKVGGIGILHNDNSVSQKIYLGYGREPWNNGLTLDNNGDAILKGKISVNQILNRNPFAVLATSGDGTQAIECGTGETDVYIHNKKINTYLQMKNDNTIQYNNQKIYHEGFKPTPEAIGAQPLGSTYFSVFTNGNGSKYVAVRTPNRKKDEYYEFYDECGWAEIYCGNVSIKEGNLKIRDKVSIEFNADNNAIEFIAL